MQRAVTVAAGEADPVADFRRATPELGSRDEVQLSAAFETYAITALRSGDGADPSLSRDSFVSRRRRIVAAILRMLRRDIRRTARVPRSLIISGLRECRSRENHNERAHPRRSTDPLLHSVLHISPVVSNTMTNDTRRYRLHAAVAERTGSPVHESLSRPCSLLASPLRKTSPRCIP
jgi:hypothetical protein